MTKNRNLFSVISIILVFTMCFSFCAYAASDNEKDYTIGSASWDEGGQDIKAIWDKAESKTSYSVQLYKGSKTVGKAITCSGTSHSFCQAIADEGKGTYTFKVYSKKGGKEDTIVESDPLEVDSSYLSAIKKMAKNLKKEVEDNKKEVTVTVGWKPNPNGTWMYAKDNSGYIKNAWCEVDGEWYYFDSKGYMLTGWQGIGKWWFYLDPDGKHGKPEGALWTDTNTPDGYNVNKDGVYCIRGVGVPYEKKTEEKSSSSKNSSSGSSSSKGSTKQKIKLSAPNNLYLTSENVLKWDKVPNATKYKIKYYYDGKLVETYTGTSAQINLDSKEIDVSSSTKISVSALGQDTADIKYTESNYMTITDMEQFAEKYTIPGTLKTNGTTLSYTDEYGDKVTGWVELAGHWYHFNDKGKAEPEGWFKDTDGLWYYFNSYHRMVKGKINDGGKEYFLNDGSDKSLPLGAWKE